MWTRRATVFLSLLAACATAPPLQLGAHESVPAGEALVLGRVEVFQAATQVIGRSGSAAPAEGWGAFYLAVAPERGGDTRSHQLTDGQLRWHLPPGRYGIWGFARNCKTGVSMGAISATFDVPPGASTVYIGTLRIRFGEGTTETHAAVHGVPVGFLWYAVWVARLHDMPSLLVPFSVQVADERDEELRAARPIVPRGVAAITSLLRLPAADAVDPSLTASEGIDGGRTVLRVVRPVRPERPFQTGGWVETESFAPTLEWEALAGLDDPGVTYDVRVSRVISTSGSTAYGSGPWTWGPVEYLRTRLAETRHHIETPLPPSSYFYWEVRLRRGDVVGPWSSFDLVPVPTPDRDETMPEPPPDDRVRDDLVPAKRGAFGFRTPAR